MKTTLISLAVVATLFLIGYYIFHYILYGSFVRDCIYTEEKLPIPEQLIQGQLVTTKEAYLAIGTDPEYSCLMDLTKIDREIVAPSTINNITIGRRYFTDQGLAIESIKENTSFRIIGETAVTKHGITTIDSGSGPTNYLILADHDGKKYKLATVSLGTNKYDLFMAYKDPAKSVDLLLSSYYFDGVTGKIIAAPKSDDGRPLAPEWVTQ